MTNIVPTEPGEPLAIDLDWENHKLRTANARLAHKNRHLREHVRQLNVGITKRTITINNLLRSLDLANERTRKLQQVVEQADD